MANTEKVPDEVMKEIAEGPAGNKEYLAHKKRCLGNFKKHLEEVEKTGEDIENLVENKPQFEIYVKNYFFGIRVKETIQDKLTGKLDRSGRLVPPTMGYAKNIKAVLFGVLTREFKVGVIFIIDLFCCILSTI